MGASAAVAAKREEEEEEEKDKGEEEEEDEWERSIREHEGPQCDFCQWSSQVRPSPSISVHVHPPFASPLTLPLAFALSVLRPPSSILRGPWSIATTNLPQWCCGLCVCGRVWACT